jgi:tetraacyldisaccharide 4'-kinase
LSKIDWSDLHETNGFTIITLPLAVMSFLYGIGVRLRHATAKMKKKRPLPGFVISVGNLTTGGTGKTPAVKMLAKWVLEEGFRVAILSRGYGGEYATKVFVVSDGKRIIAGPEKTGDEPYLLAHGLKEVPVIVSRNRYSAGLFAFREFGSNFFILDDGFQHIGLKRDMDIVLVDTASPFGNGHLLPWGPLREPIGHIKRADAIIFTRSENKTVENRNEGLFNGIVQFRGAHIPDKLILPFEHREAPPEELKGKRITAFAGIARPVAFKNTLSKLGAEMLSFKRFRDHHPYTGYEINELKEEKERLGADYLITTEKDWVRIQRESADIEGLGYLTINFAITSEQEAFFDMIKKGAEDRLRDSAISFHDRKTME